MACCGQKRTELHHASSTTQTTNTANARLTNPQVQSAPQIRPQPNYSSHGAPSAFITLSYLQTAPIQVRGPVTGQAYRFSSSYPEQVVDARDVEMLLHTRLFRRR